MAKQFRGRRVYVETSVWGMVPPGQSRVLREPTLEFLDQCTSRVYLPGISDIVTDEIRNAPPETRSHILTKIADVDPVQLPLSGEVEALAEHFLHEGVLPKKRLDDARHVACAMINELDLLVSWNYRHIANARKAEAFNAVAVLAGWPGGLQIHTPLEVLGWK